MAEKLRRKGFSDDEIAESLVRLDDLELLDDARLAVRFVEFRSVDRGWGPRRLANELRRKGRERARDFSAASAAGALLSAYRGALR